MKANQPPHAQNRQCSDWAEITECLGEFSPPETSIDSEGGVTAKAWAFRGLKSSCYELQPAIERQASKMEWSALETRVSFEFKARARMHLSAHLIPGDELTWLAQMQHYSIPTRLVDFTYSPFVALYFAIGNSHEEVRRSHVRIWAVNVVAVKDRFQQVARQASTKDERPCKLPTATLHPATHTTPRDDMTTETQGLQELIAESLSAIGGRRYEQNRQGCVAAALPPAFNPRLASQQGLFLLNCAEDLSFKESLSKMMEPCSGWCKTFDIPVGLIPEIENRLFQMNIHEQSLFPDMEGLAGLIRQKIRLQWK